MNDPLRHAPRASPPQSPGTHVGVRCRGGNGIASRRGFALVEVMITVVLLSIGLLGLAGLQTRTVAAQIESYQRVQALIIAQDMVDRMSANKSFAPQLVADDYGSGPEVSCSALVGGPLAACAWGNLIRGTTEKTGGRTAGTLSGGRGCVSKTSVGRYLVVVTWQGFSPGPVPGVSCGAGAYGDEALRRAVAVPVHLADLAGA